jgi:hypothetical protein
MAVQRADACRFVLRTPRRPDAKGEQETAMAISRKAFLIQAAGGGWLLATAGCGGGGGYSGSSSNPPAPPAGSGCAATISDNHGHVLAIAAADLDSSADKTYDIQGNADHSHNVTFTAAQLAQLKAGNTVSVTTTMTLNHDHRIGEHCA